MIRYLRLFPENKQAVSEVIGIILITSIVIAISTAIYVYVDQISASELHTLPMVNMRQSGDHIIIIGVQYGPINKDDIIINVVGDAGSCTGQLNAAGTNIASGDTITISGWISGETYMVQMIYMNSQVGAAKYNAP